MHVMKGPSTPPTPAHHHHHPNLHSSPAGQSWRGRVEAGDLASSSNGGGGGRGFGGSWSSFLPAPHIKVCWCVWEGEGALMQDCACGPARSNEKGGCYLRSCSRGSSQTL